MDRQDVPSGAAAVEAREAQERTSKHGSRKKHKHVQLPQQAHLPAQQPQQQLSQARYLAPPGSYPPTGMPVAAGVMPIAGMASSYPGMTMLNPYAAGVSQGLPSGAHSHGSTASTSSGKTKRADAQRSRGHSASHGSGHHSRHRKQRRSVESDSETEISDSDSDGSSGSSDASDDDSQETAFHSSRSRRARSPAGVGGRSRSSSKSRSRRRH